MEIYRSNFAILGDHAARSAMPTHAGAAAAIVAGRTAAVPADFFTAAHPVRRAPDAGRAPPLSILYEIRICPSIVITARAHSPLSPL